MTGREREREEEREGGLYGLRCAGKETEPWGWRFIYTPAGVATSPTTRPLVSFPSTIARFTARSRTYIPNCRAIYILVNDILAMKPKMINKKA